MAETDVRKNSWLCLYAICQIGKPYWYATSGQISTTELYSNVVSPAIIQDLGAANLYGDYMDQLHVKVHDCSGLPLGALTCESVGAEPTLPDPIAHGSTSQYYYECDTRSNTMDDFPYIPGTLVFKSSGDYTKSHVGIYVGNFIDLDGKPHTEEVVEAKGHYYGVVTSDLDSWDSWGQLRCCTIDTEPGMSFDARTVTAADNVTINIDPKAMTPFVATVPPYYYKEFDYNKIKDARISAMSFFGGELFDDNHDKQTYINPDLQDLIQDCNNNGMSYMLYVNVRAKSEIEADEECRALYYVLSQFPPKLGLWLSLKTTNVKSLNNSILEIYYKYITRWGLKDKCGLYLREPDLNSIDWTTFQDRFNLWLIKPMEVSKVDDELLQPEMFEVPD